MKELPDRRAAARIGTVVIWMKTLRITAHPAGPDRFDVRLPDGRLLLVACHDPLTDAATLLAGIGIDPSVRLVLRHAGSMTDAMRGSVSAFAGKTIKEGPLGPEYRRLRKAPLTPANRPPVAVSDLVGMMEPDDGSFGLAGVSPDTATSPPPPNGGTP